MIVDGTPYRTVWMEGATVRMINQLLLPHFFEIVDLPDHHATANIDQPGIGIADSVFFIEFG